MDIYDQINSIKKLLKLNNSDLGELVNKSGDTLRKALSRKSLSTFELMFLTKQLYSLAVKKELENTSEIILFKKTINGIISENKKQLNSDLDIDEENVVSFKVNEIKEVYKTKSGNIIDELPNGKYLLTVPLLPFKAQATYISEFQDAEYISDLTKVSFIVDRVPRGHYMAFEIQNDSMNDATLEKGPSRDAILNGDIVLARELGKQHWTSKLNTNGFPYWIIVHKDTIVCKEIINHNVEKGIITCHSLNSSPEFQDFDLKLNDCHQLFNIIKKQI